MTDFVFPQGIFRRHEIPEGDYLMSLREDLTKEFMAGFNTLEEAINNRGNNNFNPDRGEAEGFENDIYNQILQTQNTETKEFKGNLNAWKSVSFRYKRVDDAMDVDWTMEEDNLYAKLYPTAYELVKKYGEYCPMANYSYMAPNSVLHRHTGPENRQGKYIRIHIPLIIPEGEIFLEVNGEVVDWSDLFGFNNQLPHSSWNMSPNHRLIFLIDIDREYMGMEPGVPYDPRFEQLARPFVREEK